MTNHTFALPPIARKLHTEKQFHGITLVDDYAWLREKELLEVTRISKQRMPTPSPSWLPWLICARSSTARCSRT